MPKSTPICLIEVGLGIIFVSHRMEMNHLPEGVSLTVIDDG
jgi:hypothetical protein